VDFDYIKRKLLSIEEFYSDTALNMQREWETKSVRDDFKTQLK
jgi:hypothetical protein